MTVTPRLRHMARTRPGSARYRQERRRRLYEKQSGRCHWCKRKMKLEGGRKGRPPANYATFEHLKPRAIGGGWGCNNIVLACFQCNFMRGATGDQIERAIDNQEAGEIQ